MNGLIKDLLQKSTLRSYTKNFLRNFKIRKFVCSPAKGRLRLWSVREDLFIMALSDFYSSLV